MPQVGGKLIGVSQKRQAVRAELRPDGLGPIDQYDAQSLGRSVSAVHQQPVAQLERQLDAGEVGADDGDDRLCDVTGDLRPPH